MTFEPTFKTNWRDENWRDEVEGVVKYEVYTGHTALALREAWYLNKKCHRENGPACTWICFSSGKKHTEYYFDGVWYSTIKTNNEWVEKIKELIIQEIIE